MPSPIVHFQVATNDPAKASQFFRDVFDWEIGPGAGSVAGFIDTGASQVVPNDINVGGTLRELPEGAAPFTSVFVRVADLDGTLAKAAEHGASVILPRTDTPGGPTVAIIGTPFGPFGLVQL